MQRIRTAVFGTGFVGRVHLEGIRRLGFVDIAAIGHPRKEKAEQVAAEFGAKAETDYRRVLEDKSIDAVMAAQAELVDVLHTLKQVMCIKG